MSNCCIFALLLYLRRKAKGKRCYIAMRRSDMARFPHFLVLELRGSTFRCISFKPKNPRHKPVPPLLFDGRAVWGDEPPK